MGICSSTESIPVSTIKLVHQDGTLQEFPYTVKVSQVLHKNVPSGYFICNADDMDFGDFVSEMAADEDLVPGQLYFALPLSRLKYPLEAEVIAALAVKASSALTKNGKVVPLSFSGMDSGKRRSKCSTGGSGRGSSRNFTCKLSAIQE